ncbi:xanthine oxidase, putative [Babesia ovata]|uniref:Xanthine oxidase, putative n=1 Tax=Babesia ovata TaxID=189622 RepID=A0A2H6KCV7_9APIC|nr:xanthine oxidase, putative [Babesia ovata]GBE60828.1 xanthine oxidase, putative [Babesia ovata]
MSLRAGGSALRLGVRAAGAGRPNSRHAIGWHRTFSFIRSLFEPETQIDKTPAAVSLFDKETAFHDFQSNLNALLSRDDARFDEYVAFLKESKYPLESNDPSFEKYSTGNLVRLLDAMTFLSHCGHADTHLKMVDLVTREIASRQLLTEDGSGVDTLINCAKCLSRNVRVTGATRLMNHINREVRTHAPMLLQAGCFVNVISALSHIVHPSVIGMLVHTCCVRSDDLLPNDLSLMPMLLRNFKIANSRLIMPLLERVSNGPMTCFDSASQLRRFFQDVASMEYMENSDGMLLEKPINRLVAMLMSNVDRYSTSECVFLISSLPKSKHLPPEAKDIYGTLLRRVLMNIGILVDTNGVVQVNGDIANVLKSITEYQLPGVVDAVCRHDPFYPDMKSEASDTITWILTAGEKGGIAMENKLGKLLNALAEEVCRRRNEPVPPRGAQDKSASSDYQHLTNVTEEIVLLRLVDRLVTADQPGSLKDTHERLLKTIASQINSQMQRQHETLYSLTNEVSKCHPLVQWALIKPVFTALMRETGNTKEWLTASSSAFKMLYNWDLKQSHKGDSHDADSADSKFVNQVVSHYVDALVGSKLDRTNSVVAFEILSQVYLLLKSGKCGLVDGKCDDLLPRVSKRLLQFLKRPGETLSGKAVRKLAQLTAGDEVGDYIHELMAAWANDSGEQKPRGINLNIAVEYVIASNIAMLDTAEMAENAVDRICKVAELAAERLGDLETSIDTKFARNNYAQQGERQANTYVWEPSIGLKSLFNKPIEPLDMFLVDTMKGLEKYVPAERYTGIDNYAGGIISLHQLKRRLQKLQGRISELELRITVLLKVEEEPSAANMEQLLSSLNKLSSGVNRCVLAVAIAEPAWPDTYLPRKHTRSLVDSALKRFVPG